MGSLMKLLENKVALITGAAQGIGCAIAKRFALSGAIVYANDISEGSLSPLLKWAEENSCDIRAVCFDVTENKMAKNAIMQIKKETGRLDVLVNNAGIMLDELIGMITQDKMRKTFDVNVFASIELLQLAARIMIKQKSGSIINMSSIVGVNGNKGELVYSASKGAVISMTKTAAKELAPSGIRVNAIAPGIINTPMFEAVGEEYKKEKKACIGMGRIGEPDDVAKACEFLASDLSEYVTGQIIGVDGSALV